MNSSAKIETFADREEWAAARSGRESGVGASESAAILGVSPWSNATKVWLLKTGRIHPDPVSIPMRAGTALESLILDLYREETGCQVFPFNQSARLRSIPYEWMTATPDGVRDDGNLVECKSIEIRNREQADEWGRPGTDEVPQQYLIQVHHQMAVTGSSRVDLAVLVGKSEFRVYHVERNEDLAATIIGATGIFWRECVVADRPPDDEFVSAVQLLKIYPECEGSIDLGADIAEIVGMIEEIQGRSKRCDEEKARLNARVLKALGTAQFGRLPDGRMIKRVVTRVPERTQVVKAHEKQYFRIMKGA